MGLLMNYTDPNKAHLGMGGGTTGTETPTSNETTDIAQMYLEWAASNPNATLEQAFAAGADIALGNNQPIGLGQVDEFEELSPEGVIDKSGWRDTVIDISDVQPGGPQG